MYPVNPQQLIQMIKSGQNPQQVLFSILQGQANTPIGANLLNLAKEGNTKEIERIVRNLYAQQGGADFDGDLKAFKQMLGL